MEQQLNPQAIRLLRADQLAALAAERTSRRQSAPSAPPRRRFAPCLELGAFSPGDAVRVQQALEPLASGRDLSQPVCGRDRELWVFIPLSANRQAQTRRPPNSRSSAVEDFYIVQEDSKFRFAISLACLKPRRQRVAARGIGQKGCSNGPGRSQGTSVGDEACLLSIGHS